MVVIRNHHNCFPRSTKKFCSRKCNRFFKLYYRCRNSQRHSSYICTRQHQFVSATTNAITANTGTQFTPTAATYNGSTGVLQLTIAGHNLTGSNTIQIANDSLSFRCSMDRYLSVHTYPRSTDPASGQNLSVTVIDGNTIQVNVRLSPSGGNVNPTTNGINYEYSGK